MEKYSKIKECLGYFCFLRLFVLSNVNTATFLKIF